MPAGAGQLPHRVGDAESLTWRAADTARPGDRAGFSSAGAEAPERRSCRPARGQRRCGQRGPGAGTPAGRPGPRLGPPGRWSALKVGKRPEAERRGVRYLQGGRGRELTPTQLSAEFVHRIVRHCRDQEWLVPALRVAPVCGAPPWGLTLCLALYMACKKQYFHGERDRPSAGTVRKRPHPLTPTATYFLQAFLFLAASYRMGFSHLCPAWLPHPTPPRGFP